MTGTEHQRASRLLVVEDDQGQLRTLTAVMRAEGFEVVGCSSAGEAHELLGSQEIDVAILDLRLGDLSEAELIGGLRDVAESVPIIVHTAYASYETARDLLNIGAFAYVEKGGDPGELVRCVRKAIEVRFRGRTEDLESAVRERTRDLRRANEAMRESEERYRSIFETSRAGIVVVDAEDGHIEDCNAQFENLSGRTLEELRKTKVWEIRPREKREASRAKFLEIRADGNGGSADLEFQRPDGSIVHVDFTAQRLTLGGKEYLQGVVLDITERKRAEEALIESEEKYRRLFATVPDALAVFDAQTQRVLDVNEAALRLYGYTRDEFLSLEFADISADPQQCQANIQQVIATTQDRIPVGYHKKKDGTVFPVEVSTSSFILSGRSVLCGVVRDITERTKAERDLKFFRDVLDRSNDAILVASSETGRIVDANDMACTMLGYDRGELLALRIHDIDPLMRDQAFAENLFGHLERDGAFLFESVARGKDGGEVPVEINAKQVQLDGRLYLLAIGRDTTERKQAEEKLRFLSSVTQQVSDGIITTNLDYEITYTNQAIQRLYGYSGEELLGRSAGILNADPNAEQIQNDIYQAISSGRLWTGEVLNRKKDGSTFICELRVFPLVDDQGHTYAYAGVQRDITERKAAEEALALKSRVNQMLLDALPCVALLVKPATREIVASNRAAVEVGAVPGKTCFQTWGLSDSPCPWCLAPELWSTGQPQHLQPEGLGRVWDAHWLPVTDDLYLHYAFDITERKQTEDKIRKAKESYDRIIDNADEVIFRVQAEGGHVVYANPAAERLLGYSQAEWLADPTLGFRIIVPESREKQREIIEEINTTKKPIKNAVLGWRAKDGREVIIEYTIIPVMDEQGRMLYFESLGRDITERKRAEEALRDSEERYRQVVSSTIDAVMVFDAETRKFIEVNEACTRLYGYRREEFLDMTQSRITAEQDASDDSIEKALAGKLDSIPVRYHRKKDGSVFPVEITASTFTYRGRAVICGVVRDITERRAAEEALELRTCVNQMLLDSLPHVALLMRPATREIVASNRAAF